ncbi:CHAT domain-containing protein [Leptolyngbya cf. ectocarpi LEGE 11479]|uniref:CHAT domain-containing protein n=1 Tax=Leptolyngbya cf. ectocarpi LEGE 11479 TaxID=1828722 RepID=A0A928ZZP9_LEPEC|nr:CHAT domain-containing protein [Leptolyngbya ectocarpi]MBE9070405.1 CHAT domain-containing protein [Leptolyngbya cf. ectocarpi LEGE 11479]
MSFLPHALLRALKSWRWLLAPLVCLLVIVPTAAIPQELTPNQMVLGMELRLETEYETYFGENLTDVTQSSAEIAATLARVGEETGTTPAVLWATPREDRLSLVLITPNGEPIVRDLYDAPKERLEKTTEQFYRHISRPSGNAYLPAARQLYDWLIGTYEDEFLAPAGIDTLLVCASDGLRGLALPALYDGQQFLIEKYKTAIIPAFNLIETDYRPIESNNLLAMGASEFTDLSPLPAVPVELSNIAWQLRTAGGRDRTWQDRSLLNQSFTLENFNTLLSRQSYDIVHLATHAEFKPGRPDNSYIQLWDQRLTLEEMSNLDWQLPQLELLVLSACETAVGDSDAELGFAGLALRAGVKSAVASLWDVSDTGTLALMSEFYHQIPKTATKAGALRQAQLNLLRGNTEAIDLSRLPKTANAVQPADDLSHPFYWAGFSMISSPW